MTDRNTLRRTGLYVSASSPVNMAQAPFYNEDMLIYDLEDSVPRTEKDAARLLVYHTVKYHRPKDKEVVIRVNGIDTVYFEQDLECAVKAEPDTIRLPKVESAAQVEQVSEQMERLEQAAGIPKGKIHLICNIESFQGILHAQEIAAASPRNVALALSAEDFTASMKMERTKAGMEIFYARNVLVLACRAAGIQALDVVFSDINDLEGLRQDCQVTRNMGFDGKTVIHPRQIDIANSFFTPSEKEIAHAVQVLEAIEEGRRLGKGAVSLNGSMIDEPVVLRAQNTIARAKAAGIRIGGEAS